MTTARATVIAVVAQVLIAIGGGTAWLVREITVRRVGVGVVVVAAIVAGSVVAIWLVAAVLGYFLSPTGCAWLFGIGPCS